jgi:hypothetical protein
MSSLFSFACYEVYSAERLRKTSNFEEMPVTADELLRMKQVIQGLPICGHVAVSLRVSSMKQC